MEEDDAKTFLALGSLPTLPPRRQAQEKPVLTADL
jgi:hypothetical protein